MAQSVLNQHTTSGFYKAPVCKGLLGTMFLACSAIHIPMTSRLKHYLVCQIPQLLSTSNIWRILLNRLTFIHTKDLICSVLIIYCFRIFERRMSSRKFASYILGSCVFATLLEICCILTLKEVDIDLHSGGYLPPGMYGMIFPLFVCYFFDIPRVTSSTFMGVPVSSKTMPYLLGLQVASTSFPTMIAACCGVIGGLLYRYNFLKCHRWLCVPNFVGKVFDRMLGWAMKSSEPKHRQMGATLELQRQEQADLWEQQYMYQRAQGFRQGFEAQNGQEGFFSNFMRNRRAPGAREVEPTEENIQTLVNMGFDRTQVVEALRAASNDIVTDTSILLRG